MNVQRTIERRVRGFLIIKEDQMMLKTGDMKQRTMRSPIGSKGIAVSTLKLDVEVSKP